MDDDRGACAYPWQQMNIDLTGEVVPCCFWSGYGNHGAALGNTNEQTLDEIWNGEGYRALRRANASGDPPEGHPCRQCLSWKWSGGKYPGFVWPVSFRRETGHCHTVAIPRRFRETAAAVGEPALLHEDGVALPSPDAIHDDIRREGAGRYSVWGETLYFSSSDNSDPTRNGRRYELRCGDVRWNLTGLVRDSDSGRNLVLAREEYERGAEVVQARPTLLSFISTSDCNIDCPACSQNLVRLLRVQHRPQTEIDVLAHVRHLHQFIWHGGEPYLIRRFREFVDGFRTEDNPNLTFGFTSNGTLLDADELAKLDKFPRVNASISVDSFVEETFEAIRAGANFGHVLRNVLRAVETYDAPDRVVSVGMVVNKLNFRELPDNLGFAFEHDIGLNLSPVVVVPVHDRIDVFEDFARQTEGWDDALAAARAVLARAVAEKRVALSRVDPTGMVDALQDILDAARRRYAECRTIAVTIEDPSGSLARMHRPGFIVARDDEHHRPLCYLETPAAGEYTLRLPAGDLSGGRHVRWYFCHDLGEAMGVIDSEALLDETGCAAHQAGWRTIPALIEFVVPTFTPPPRTRKNIRVANLGLPTTDGRQVLGNVDMVVAYNELLVRESTRGLGPGRPSEIRHTFRYASFQSL